MMRCVGFFIPLFVLMLIAGPVVLSAQGQVPRFQHLQIEDGLSQTTVQDILQDSRGFMWFATQDGLNRYDGHDIDVYRSDSDVSGSLSSNDIMVIYEDHLATLWIGTSDGLNRFDRDLESFTHFHHRSDETNSLSRDHITSIYEDLGGVLWVGTPGGGLNAFDRESETFTRYRHQAGDSGSLSSDFVDVIYEDRSRRLWIGTDNGLNRMDRETGRFTSIHHNPQDPHSIGRGAISAIHEDAEGDMWIGTSAGLYSFDGISSRFSRYEHDPNDPASIGPGVVSSIHEDRSGVLWVGTDGGGLHVVDRETGRFHHFRHDPYLAESLGDDRVLSIYEDRTGAIWVGFASRGVDRYDPSSTKFTPQRSQPGLADGGSDYVRTFLIDRLGGLWIGTEGNGLSRIDRATGRSIAYRYDPNDSRSLRSDRVYSLHEDGVGTLWVGTFGGGFSEFNRATGTFIHHDLPLPPMSNVRTNSIRVIHEDRSGLFWLGTQGGGLLTFDRATGEGSQFPGFSSVSRAVGGERVFAISEDRAGNLWVGTFGGGLAKLDPVTGAVVWYTNIEGDTNSLSADRILAVHEDRLGRIWISAAGGGLDRLDQDSGSFKNYDESSGLLNTSVYGILEDDDGRLWISHNKGLSRLDPSTGEFRNYDVNDGLQSNEFNGGAAYRSPTGEMFFGGISGYNAFYPDSIRDNPNVPPVVLTDFQIFNRSVPIGEGPNGRTILTRSISETDALVLTYRDQVFSFEFAALLFGATDKNQYAYMMEGFEDDWNYVDARRYATYTNLPQGRYVFRVKAANGDGVWNEEGASVRIRIEPPFWKTIWFVGLAVLVCVAGAWGFHVNRTRLIHLRANELELVVGERTAELKLEIAEREEIQKQLATAHQESLRATRSKSEFLANMSHEIRTPMNGVLGMAQLVLDTELAPQQRDFIETIHSSGEALLTIINDILDFSKIEAGKLGIEPIPFDLQVASSEVADLLALKAAEKGLELVVRYSPGAPRYLVGDAGRIRQMMLNLAGNAIKFTSEGHVLIEVDRIEQSENDALMKVSFHDTGIGVTEEVRGSLFQAFSQADGSTTRKFGGTGLGLAISRQLVELMGGEIGVESVPGEGSTFWFTLKLPLAPDIERTQLPKVDLAGVRVLIVDDMDVNRRVLSEQLTSFGMVPEMATSGEEALICLREAVAVGKPYPMAVLDYLMPEMDGEQLGQLIKKDPTLQETELVLLTSAGAPGDGRRFEKAGFAAYLVKPARSDTLRDVLTTVCASKLTGDASELLVTRHSVAEARAISEVGTHDDPQGRGWRVLVAEDNIVNQKVAKRMLEKLGCVVDVAANGEEALSMWSRLPYHVVFMDCQMPELDGYAATGAMRKQEGPERHTPVIAMTANAMEGDRERCLAAGMDDYLAKPVRMDAVREMLHKWVTDDREDGSADA